MRLTSTYGPTEATVVATRCDLVAASGALWRVPTGRPVDGACARLLDLQLRPVPLGAAGEFCLGGAGVARAYLGRPEVTAERYSATANLRRRSILE